MPVGAGELAMFGALDVFDAEERASRAIAIKLEEHRRDRDALSATHQKQAASWPGTEPSSGQIPLPRPGFRRSGQ